MTIIQKINIFLRKKFNYLLLLDTKVLKFGKFNPVFIISFLVVFSCLFFITSNLINKNNQKNADGLEEITKTKEFTNFTNFLISKINSPYE